MREKQAEHDAKTKDGCSVVVVHRGPRVLLRRHGAAALLLVLIAVLTSRGITDGGFRFSDASRHAMDGVFIHDCFADLPRSVTNPLNYAIHYYAQYPAVTIGLYYPPFFAMVEAFFFAVFGISAVTARWTVVAFALLGGLMTFRLISAIGTRRAGFLAAATFTALPTVVFWSREVMLEVPTAAMIVTACYFFYRYVELGHRRSALWTGVLTVAAVLTKQPALYIIPAFGLYLVLQRRRDVLRQWEFWCGAAIIFFTVVPYLAVNLHYAHFFTSTTVNGAGNRVGTSIYRVSQAWANGLSIPLLGLTVVATIGLVGWDLWRPRQPGVRLLGALVLMFASESVVLKLSGTRYPIIGLPFLIAFLPLLLDRLGVLKQRIIMAVGVVGVAVLASFSYLQPVPVTRGYSDLAREIVRQSGASRFVLFDGYWDGDIVFFVRCFDPERRLFVLRGSKVLYSYATFKRFGFEQFITTRDELLDFMSHYGIRVVAIEDEDLVNTAPGGVLRAVLDDPNDFTLSASFPVFSSRSSLNRLNLLLFNRIGENSVPRAEKLSIPLRGLQRTIVIDLKQDHSAKIVYSPWKKEG